METPPSDGRSGAFMAAAVEYRDATEEWLDGELAREASERSLKLQINAVDAGGWGAALVYADGGILAAAGGETRKAAMEDLLLMLRFA
jgi:hypothetical protein